MFVAVVVVIFLLALGLGAGFVLSTRMPSTTTTTTTSVQTTTVSSSGQQASRLYELVFNQTGFFCSSVAYASPWAVSLNNKTTIVEPASATAPIQESGVEEYSPSFKNTSVIIFSVPNGTYSYTILPKSVFQQSGNITVSSSDQVVRVTYLPPPCRTTT